MVRCPSQEVKLKSRSEIPPGAAHWRMGWGQAEARS